MDSYETEIGEGWSQFFCLKIDFVDFVDFVDFDDESVDTNTEQLFVIRFLSILRLNGYEIILTKTNYIILMYAAN